MTDNANPVMARTNTLAIIAIITTFVFAPAGLICGIVARNQIKQTREQGDGMALAAIIVSAAILVLWLFAFVFAAALFDHAVNHISTCFNQKPPFAAPGPGLHWVCTGNNTWMSQG
jgi:hypothetical protein